MALAEIISHDPTLTELAVTGTATKLDGFADDAALAIASDLSCISPVSGNRSIVVDSAKTDFRGIDAGGGVQISIGNLIACKGDAVERGFRRHCLRRDEGGGYARRARDKWVGLDPPTSKRDPSPCVCRGNAVGVLCLTLLAVRHHRAFCRPRTATRSVRLATPVAAPPARGRRSASGRTTADIIASRSSCHSRLRAGAGTTATPAP